MSSKEVFVWATATEAAEALAQQYYRKWRRAKGYAYRALWERKMWEALMRAAGMPV